MTVSARVVVVRSLLGPVAEKKLRARGIRALCPMYSREVRHARRTETKSYPLYSCYMFVWVEDDELRRVLAVRECVDVLRKVGDARAMGVVSDDVIACISGAGVFQEYKPGDRISITHGRWEGLNGLYQRSEGERVMLLFKLLGREVEMPFQRSETSKTLETGYA